MSDQKLTISTSPFLKDAATTPGIMWKVVFSLLPVVIASSYYFGVGALVTTAVAIISCVLTEWFFSPRSAYSISDGSGVITGILLAMTLPPGFPLWMTFIGGIVAIGMGKTIWGGLGQNIFNPALLGRAFLQAAFPTAITTWNLPDGAFLDVQASQLAMPFMQSQADVVSSATPLAVMKFDKVETNTWDLLTGNIGGSLGETCGILLILAMVYLISVKIIKWQIPVSILLTVGILSLVFYLLDANNYPSPQFMILSGGLLIGAVYMATDLVTSPITPSGLWIYGIGIGILVVLIRLWGGLPEGVMYAILLMNAATPLINRYTAVRTYGYKK